MQNLDVRKGMRVKTSANLLRHASPANMLVADGSTERRQSDTYGTVYDSVSGGRGVWWVQHENDRSYAP